jgi:hypothetical protein
MTAFTKDEYLLLYKKKWHVFSLHSAAQTIVYYLLDTGTNKIFKINEKIIQSLLDDKIADLNTLAKTIK